VELKNPSKHPKIHDQRYKGCHIISEIGTILRSIKIHRKHRTYFRGTTKKIADNIDELKCRFRDYVLTNLTGVVVIFGQQAIG